MRHRLVFAIAVFALLASCVVPQPAADSTRWEPMRRFSGRYVFGFEVSEFTAAGSTERWWLSGEMGPITNKLVAPLGEKPRMHSPVFVTIEGQLSSPGHHGHLGQYIRELRVTRVVSVRQSS
jgi:hypothetical protein